MTHRSVIKPTPGMTQQRSETAGLTLMTHQSEINPMTDDRFSPVDPHYAGAQSEETSTNTQPVIRTPPQRRQHLLTEPAQLTHCTHCQQPVIRAHSEGILTTCDPQPLTPHQELHALLTGRTTYQLTPVAGHTELHWRYALLIRAHQPYPVIATHQCPPTATTGSRRRQLPPPVVIRSRPTPAAVADARPPF